MNFLHIYKIYISIYTYLLKKSAGGLQNNKKKKKRKDVIPYSACTLKTVSVESS